MTITTSLEDVSGSDINVSPLPNTKCLSSDFWQNFNEEYWEKKSYAVKKGLVSLPINQDALYECIVEHCALGDESGAQISLYIERQEYSIEECQRLGYFPLLSDGSFDAYYKRMDAELKGKYFVLLLDVIDIPMALRAWCYEFLQGMYRPLKKLNDGHYFSMFFGNYRQTPFGVHDHVSLTQSESAFYFPVVGKKEMRIWTPEYANRHPDLKDCTDYSKYVHESELLSACQSGMMYWPSDRWHVGASTGGDISIVLAIRAVKDQFEYFGEFLVDEFESFFNSELKGLWARLMTELKIKSHITKLKFSEKARNRQIRSLTFDPDDLQKSAQALPKELLSIAASYRSLVSDEELDYLVSKFWLCQLSTYGMYPEPICRAKVISQKTSSKRKHVGASQLSRVKGIPVLWRKLKSGKIIIVCNRMFYLMTDTKGAVMVLDYFSSVDEIKVERLVKIYQSITGNFSALEAEVEGLVEFCLNSGSFQSSTK